MKKLLELVIFERVAVVPKRNVASTSINVLSALELVFTVEHLVSSKQRCEQLRSVVSHLIRNLLWAETVRVEPLILTLSVA